LPAIVYQRQARGKPALRLAGNYTFWHYGLPNSFKRDLGWRLHQIIGTKTLAEECTLCSIGKVPRAADNPSDQTPLTAEFNW